MESIRYINAVFGTVSAPAERTAASLAAGILACFGKYLLYLAACVALLLTLRALFPIPREVWRKALHIIAFTSALCMMLVSGDWLVSALCCVIFGAVVYPILHLLERWPGYGDLFIQRSTGEVKKSLLLVFWSHAFLIALFWGWLDTPWVIFTAIPAWGFGDIAAALVGKSRGKHHVHIPMADQKKTWEGTAAMAVTAFVTALILLLLTTDFSPLRCILMALAVAPIAAWTELISHNGNDTVTVASAVSVLLWLLAQV